MKAPACIGIILDGNRRWAKEKGLPTLEGHRAGVETLKEAVRAAGEKGIGHVAVFAFSTENWQREPAEVAYLMELFMEMAGKHAGELAREGARTRFVGQRERFSPELQKSMDAVERDTANNGKITLWICLSYGGRAEIVEAARAVAAEGGEITEESLRAHFWSAQMPDPDIIIRTGGEKRLSGFLLWQSAYSELFFIDKHWPDFAKEDLEAVLNEYAARERRMGA
jgi:undecaprenyl diphosphate synthase